MEKHAKMQAAPPSRGMRALFEWLEEIVVALTIVILILTFVFRVVTVSGSSMFPNYINGERLIVANYSSKIEQGDVVVMTNVLDEPIIKRVIATEGQTVNIDYETGIVYVDGMALDETQYGVENGTTTSPSIAYEPLVFPQTVPDNCIFVVGDNRGVSKDSRYAEVGMVDVRHVLGEAVFVIFPFDRFGSVK